MVGDVQVSLPRQYEAIWVEQLAAQLPLQAVIEEQITVECGALVPELPLTAGLARMLYLAVLERAGAVHGASHARWQEEVPEDQHERVTVVIESVGARLLIAYDDYLRRHWAQFPSEGAAWLERALARHLDAVRALLELGLDGQALLLRLDALQREWAAQTVGA